MQKIIYHYNKDQQNMYTETETLEGLVQADLLIPANATELAPPTAGLPINYVWCFHDNQWTAMPDYRTKTIHNPETREEKIMDMVGSLANGFVLGKLPPIETTIEQEQERAINTVRANAQEALEKGIAVDINGTPHTFPCTPFMLHLPAKTQYLETLDAYEEFTGEQIKTTISPAIKSNTHKVKLWEYATIKAIKEATTKEAVKGIDTTMPE